MTAGGKLFFAGLAVTAGGLGLLLARGQFPAPLPRLLTNPMAAPAAVGLFLAVVACVVYVAEPAFSTPLAEKLPYATVRTSLAMFVTALVLTTLLSLPLVAIPGNAAAGQPADARLGPWILVYLVVTSEVPLAFVVWLRLVKPARMSWRDLGLRLSSDHRAGNPHPSPLPGGEGILGLIGLGIAGGLALFLAAGLVSAGLNAVGVHQNQLERFQGIENAPLPAFLVAVLAGCVLAPFAEELFFRGYIFQTFRERYGALWAYIFSAGLFAVVHTNFAAAAPIFVLGLILAYIFRRSGSLVPGMIAHGLNNAIAFVLLYAGVKG